jgi:hypothetical protein
MAPVSPLLSLFKEQLEAECTKLSEDHNLEERGTRFYTGISSGCTTSAIARLRRFSVMVGAT